VHWFLRLWLATGVALLSLFAAVGAALWWLFRAGESSPEPLSWSQERSSSLSSVAQSLLAAEAEAAGEALELELLSSLKSSLLKKK